MNTDDPFENRLKALPPRQIPTEWRMDVLSAAQKPSLRTAPRAASSETGTLHSWIAALLWPHPSAWAALAASWVLIFALNFVGQEPSQPEQITRTIPPSPQLREMLHEQEQLFTELVGDKPKATPTTPARPQPSSRRRENLEYA